MSLKDSTETDARIDNHTPDIPPSINTPGAKLVYLYINTATATTIEDLQTGLDMKKITLFSILDTLKSADLITKTENQYQVATSTTMPAD